MPHTRERIGGSSGGFAVLSLKCHAQAALAPGDDLSDVELIRPRRRGLDLCDLRNAKRSQPPLRQLRDDEGRAVPCVRFLQCARKPILWRLWNALGRRLRGGDATRLWPWGPCSRRV
jgi:hypothetical protein